MNSLSIPEDLATLAEAYLDGHLTDAERRAFEGRLATDPAAQAAVREHQELVRTIRAAGRAELKAHLQRLEREGATTVPVTATTPVPPMTVSHRQPARVRQLWPRLAVAASVLAGATGVWWILRGPSYVDQATQYVKEPGLPVLMDGVGDPRRSAVTEAMNAYKLGNYDEALAAWQRVPPTVMAADTLSYYRGIFLLRAHRPTDAAAELRRVAVNQKSALRARAEYYSGLALWAEGKPDEARQVFTRLAAQANHPFQQAARDILPQLR